MKLKRKLMASFPHAYYWKTGVAALAFTLASYGANAGEAAKKPAAAKLAPAPAAAPPAPPPAPMGVFGADMPAPGRFTLAASAGFANFSGQRIGSQGVSSAFVAATTPYLFNPTQTLRLVPQNIAVAVQQLGMAYGVAKDFAIVITANMVERNLDMLTFKGLTRSINPLGMSYTGTAGFGDLMAAGIYRLYQDDVHRIQINLGMSFPTGSNRQIFTLLQPDASYVTSRAFYGLQPGTGTYDIMPGVVYAGHLDAWSWGLSYRGRLPLGANPEGYRWGDYHEFNAWGGYNLLPGLTTTIRAQASLMGTIRGLDWQIRGRAPAANPNFYGGQRVEIFGGATIGGKIVGLDNMSLAVEAGLPVYQNLNGPQIMKDWQAAVSVRLKI
ncbi:alpha-amylase [Methylocystis echinoides]|uniref:alpha-amylase n=1 Tax=Methylocystis echinoides TaxID=29468 RepID=UPI00342E80B9